MPIWVRITSKNTKARYLLLWLKTKTESKWALTKLQAAIATQMWCNQFETSQCFLTSQVDWNATGMGLCLYESNWDCWDLQREAFIAVWFPLCRGPLAMASKIRQLWIGKMSSPKHWKQVIWERYIGEIWNASGFAVLLVWSNHFGDSHWYPHGTKKLFV